MTDTSRNGWPEEYRDPRDRPHPTELRVTVERFDGMREQTRKAIDDVKTGDPVEAVVSFATIEELRQILTDRRIELLQTLQDTTGAAESIAALAKALDRDYRTVHDDVTMLADYGLLFLIEEGQAKRPFLPYDRIHLDVDLVRPDPAQA